MSLEVNKVHLGDCLEKMKEIPDKSIDVTITSPPYNLNKKASGGGSSKKNYNGWYFDELPEEEYQEWQKQIIRELFRITKGSIFYNHRIRYAWHSRNNYRHPNNIYHPIHWLSEFPIWCEIIWDRRATSGHANNRCRMSDERIYQLGKPHKFNEMGYSTVWQIFPSKNEGHVCSFPEELVKRCVLMSTDENDIIFDPFLGSGTVALVGKQTNRRFIGIEKDENYYKIACERIGQTL